MQSHPPDIRIAVLADQPLLREALVALLQAEDLRVVAVAASVEELLRELDAESADVAIVDLRLQQPGEQGSVDRGLDAVRQLNRAHPDVRQLVLSVEWDPRIVSACYSAGASAFLCKLEAGLERVLEAVRTLGAGRGDPLESP
jgi:DNA-binding NarL/FixJ family response regulator